VDKVVRLHPEPDLCEILMEQAIARQREAQQILSEI
jgi:hypothetical protein